MTTYKLIPYGVLKDGKYHIGNSPDNLDWVEYQRWVAAGGVAEPADPVVPPEVLDPTNPDKFRREIQTLLKVIADITNTPLGQVKAKFRSLS